MCLQQYISGFDCAMILSAEQHGWQAPMALRLILALGFLDIPNTVGLSSPTVMATKKQSKALRAD